MNSAPHSTQHTILDDYSLTADQKEKLSLYVHELFEENKKQDLTADTDGELFWNKHIFNSLHGITLISQYGGTNEKLRIADIGSGGGIPAVPLAIALPQHTFTLIEPMQKRARFLNHIVEKLHLTNIEVINGRAEIIGRQATYRETFNIVTARAVSALSSLAELALPLCVVHGSCILYKHLEENELLKAEHALTILGSAPAIVIHSEKNQQFRDFVVLHKKMTTPPTYPRRNGLPQKRPLQ